MKNLTIRAKITLWFIVILAVILGLSYTVFFFFSQSGTRQLTQIDLRETVENDMDEVSFYPPGEEPQQIEGKEYVEYKGGWLEFEDDYLKLSDGVGVGLFNEKMTMIFGDDLIPGERDRMPMAEGQVQTVRSGLADI